MYQSLQSHYFSNCCWVLLGQWSYIQYHDS